MDEQIQVTLPEGDPVPENIEVTINESTKPKRIFTTYSIATKPRNIRENKKDKEGSAVPG